MKPGFFELRTASDLLAKLERDLEKLEAAPDSSDLAFNFFVTAESLREWVSPGEANAGLRTREINSSLVLQVCSHIANGAKHFELSPRRHRSVEAAEAQHGMFSGDHFSPEMFPPGFFGGTVLVVELTGDARAAFGDEIECVPLARRVLAHWKAHPLLAG